MRVETHNALGEQQVVEATRVLVRDAYGNPVAVVLEVSGPPQCVFVTRSIADADFKQWLKLFGVSDTVVLERTASARPAITVGD